MKFYLEIETDGREAHGYEDRFHWVNYGTIVTEGDSLEELLDNATVDLVDQDGGEAAQVEADSDWMQEMIKEEFTKKYGEDMDRQDFAEQHGEEFVDEFDKEFEVGEETYTQYTPTWRDSLMRILSNKFTFYAAGFLDGILVLLALYYILK